MTEAQGLKYIGAGVATIIGVPARDLTMDEVRHFGRGWLLATGVYVEHENKFEHKKVFAPKPTKAALKGDKAETKE